MREPFAPDLCRAARGLLGWSQERLAAALDCDPGAVSAFERGAAHHGLDMRQLRLAFATARVSISRGRLHGLGVHLMSDPTLVRRRGQLRARGAIEIITAAQLRGGRLMVNRSQEVVALFAGVALDRVAAFEAEALQLTRVERLDILEVLQEWRIELTGRTAGTEGVRRG